MYVFYLSKVDQLAEWFMLLFLDPMYFTVSVHEKSDEAEINVDVREEVLKIGGQLKQVLNVLHLRAVRLNSRLKRLGLVLITIGADWCAQVSVVQVKCSESLFSLWYTIRKSTFSVEKVLHIIGYKPLIFEGAR